MDHDIEKKKKERKKERKKIYIVFNVITSEIILSD